MGANRVQRFVHPEAVTSGVRQAAAMTTPQPETLQPRDIALEQETPEQAADLEAQSEPQDSAGAN
jgi:hypothetical protein